MLLVGLVAWMHSPLLFGAYGEITATTTAVPLARPAVAVIPRPLSTPRQTGIGGYDRRGMDRLHQEVANIPLQRPEPRYKKQ